MEPQFWHERWEQNEIGFHQPKAHPLLAEHWPGIAEGGGRVFVPLCGKSVDMLWLRGQGHSVLGVELSPLAARDFFAEQGLNPAIEPVEKFTRYVVGDVEILCGDFFDLEPAQLADIQGVYDRAALIALPEDLQSRYAGHLLDLLPQRPPILLLTFEYDPAEMDGPPFSTPEAAVREWFGGVYRVELLSANEVLDEQPGLRGRGLSRLVEKAYRLAALA